MWPRKLLAFNYMRDVRQVDMKADIRAHLVEDIRRVAHSPNAEV